MDADWPVGDVGARHIPPGWHGPSRIGTRCLLLVARAARERREREIAEPHL